MANKSRQMPMCTTLTARASPATNHTSSNTKSLRRKLYTYIQSRTRAQAHSHPISFLPSYLVLAARYRSCTPFWMSCVPNIVMRTAADCRLPPMTRQENAIMPHYSDAPHLMYSSMPTPLIACRGTPIQKQQQHTTNTYYCLLSVRCAVLLYVLFLCTCSSSLRTKTKTANDDSHHPTRRTHPIWQPKKTRQPKKQRKQPRSNTRCFSLGLSIPVLDKPSLAACLSRLRVLVHRTTIRACPSKVTCLRTSVYACSSCVLLMLRISA